MKFWLSIGLVCCCSRLWGGEAVFINEIHYDNVSVDEGEGIEIAGAAGTDLSGYRLVFYNGNGGAPYKQETLSGAIDNEGGTGAGAVWFAVRGIQNGSPDGVALVEVDGGRVLEFLSYEGRMSVRGVGDSEDIGVVERGVTAVGVSLQRTGSGRCGEDFGWVGPVGGSPGEINAGQVIAVEAVDLLEVSIAPGEVSESGGVALGTLKVVPEEAVEVRVSVAPAGEVVVPGSVMLDGDGGGQFEIRGIADGVTDGDRRVEVSVEVVGDGRRARAEVIVRDVDTPDLRRGTYRVATCNLENGAGAAGTAEHEALREVLRRVDADVVAFQEASDGNGFANLKALLEGLGYGVTRDYLATGGDAFEGRVFDGGDFGSGQVLALASRDRIVETVQVGRGEPGAEMTRFPLYVAVDVEGVAEELDPHFVVVHYKAGSSDADRFRKSVEGFRTAGFLAGRGLDGRLANVFVLGDFNEDVNDFQPVSFDTGINTATHMFGDGSGFPVSYDLASDLEGAGARTLSYAPFPRLAFRSVGVRDYPAVQVDGSDRTRNDFSPRRLDYILQPALAERNGNFWQEVFNSELEPVSPGLAKRGPAVRKGKSRVASDHQVVFGDYQLGGRAGIEIEVGGGYRDEGDVRAVAVTVRGGGAGEVRLVARPPDEVELGREV
ncbi:MAG: endonuclease/exonuclease/phosphatase family protein, partial [Verrucomicrobiales bacterium]|nr:endonuclease/exonuclease/phosphatase family protein [Verrucomicrobiales bacterium]